MSKGCLKNKNQDIANNTAKDIQANLKYSLSEEGETVKDYGGWNVYGNDISLQNDVPPSQTESPRPKAIHTQTLDSSHAQKSSPPQSIYKYCSHCGQIIHPKTKKCTGCGKQYFKGVPWRKVATVSLSILLTISLVFNIILLVQKDQLNSAFSTLETQYASVNQNVSKLIEYKSKLENQLTTNNELIDFIDQYVVFIEDDETNLYHKYECTKFHGDAFWVFNKDAAVGEGYKPCPLCCN